MSILSLEFLCMMAALLVVNYCLPVRHRWLALLGASMVFYGFAGWQGLVYMGTVTALTWAGGLYMARKRRQEKELQAEGDKVGVYRKKLARSRLLALIAILVIGAMALIKYADLVHTAANALYMAITESRTPLEPVKFFVPLGLSYFTFQSIGYLVDCYRGKTEPERNPLRYLLFVSFFPQITQGPITSYKQLAPQLRNPARFEPSSFVAGFQLALWGYFKKMVIADRLAAVTNPISALEEGPGWLFLLGAVIYAIRLYADFSGGMDVIRGAAKMLGVDVTENFRRPFFSTSVGEYWRRWHISLGAWFRNYLFYPVTTSSFGLMLSKAGQRVFGKKVGRTLPGVFATFLIFLLIGVWHVANWNAIIYGVYFGVLLSLALMLEPLFKWLRGKLHINPKAWWWKGFGLVRTWILVVLPQYFAYTAGPGKAIAQLGMTFRNWDFSNVITRMTGMLPEMEYYILFASMGLLLLVDLLCEFGVDVNGKIAKSFFLFRWIVLLVLIMAVLLFGCYGADFDASAFLYTQF